ncbi:hypothetical protein Q867_11985 [Listeria monocytogenes]|nr:hypothetical protein [Listeria monocytogenes]
MFLLNTYRFPPYLISFPQYKYVKLILLEEHFLEKISQEEQKIDLRTFTNTTKYRSKHEKIEVIRLKQYLERYYFYKKVVRTILAKE